MVAVSQAPSPEPNPNSPLPVTAAASQYLANRADRSEAYISYQSINSDIKFLHIHLFLNKSRMIKEEIQTFHKVCLKIRINSRITTDIRDNRLKTTTVLMSFPQLKSMTITYTCMA